MFCSSCGTQLVENAIFCQQCGARVAGMERRAANESGAGKGLDREALKIYLSDVLALECIVKQFSTKSAEQNNDVAWLKRNNFSQRYIMNSDIGNYVCFFYDGSGYGVLTTKRGNQIEDSNCYTDSVWTRIEDVLKILNEKNTWDQFVPCTYGIFEAQKRRKMFKEKFLAAYAEFKQKAPVGYQNNLTQISALSHQNQQLRKEWNEAKNLLNKLYQVNIIPESFRNDLYAIFYLHNFVTTSDLSLETALLHYNLEEIKSKLDTIIEQQQEIIINQAITIAQNKRICEQNQRQLEHLSNIENNTYQAAQYAEIASRNAEAAAWIGLANYIGK